MKQKINLAVIFGGASSEYGVSLISASSVIDNLNRAEYEIIMVGITRDGRWYHYKGDTKRIADGTWTQCDNDQCLISPDSSVKSLMVIQNDKISYIPIDVVFPVLHGKNGEDGTIQGLLEMAQVPFVGCGMTSSAACMDKAITNTLLYSGGIKKAAFVWFYADELEDYIDEIENRLKYPVFVKPANAGSSIGITKAKDRQSLIKSVRLAAAHDNKIVVEEEIQGREVECAVMGNENPIASIVGEIEPCNDFYDYEAKYESESVLHIPAKLYKKLSDEVRETALKAYKIMGCTGLARIDFFIRRYDSMVVLNEINTIPGFTSISMYPKLFEASNIKYSLLLDGLIELAIKRQEAGNQNPDEAEVSE